MNQRSAPTRLYRCDQCGFSTERRWYLRDHLVRVHKVKKREAVSQAAASEWWLAPQYFRVKDVGHDDEKEAEDE